MLGKIIQYKCSDVLRYNGRRPDHCNRLGRLFNLKPYKDKKNGCLFFGCYTRPDYARILTHAGRTIVYWGGTDITIAKKNKWIFRNDIVHVIGNERCRKELKEMGIDAIVRPICEIEPSKFKIKPLGKKVFVYMPYKRRKFYGFNIVKKVAERFPRTTFILTRWGLNPKPFKNAEIYPLVNFEKLKELYAECFCGVRPVAHDGHSQTLIELNLMGRSVGWTYETPIQPACKTVNDYCKFIEFESKRKKPNEKVREYQLKTVNNLDFLR